VPGDVERNVTLLIAELKGIAQRHGISASVRFIASSKAKRGNDSGRPHFPTR
jgi:hypothetical protein